MPAPLLDRARDRGRASLARRGRRFRETFWHVAQCGVAAAIAWWLASDLLAHPTPLFAPIAAVLSLGTSYGQRLRRVAEVALGVAIGVLVGDVLVLLLGTGWWQIGVVVTLAMSIALLLDSGILFVMQAAVQGIFVTTLVAGPDEALVRWLDALVGGGVGLLVATVVPAAVVRRPHREAAQVLHTIADLLRGAAEVVRQGETERALALLAEARATDHRIRSLQQAAYEGLSVTASSPFRRRHAPAIRRVSALVEPLDRALRSTRVLVRQAAVAAYHRRALPPAYAELADEIAAACAQMAEEFSAGASAAPSQQALLAAGQRTGAVPRTESLSGEVVLAQLRSVVVDLLMVTGMDTLEATDSLPPPQ